MSSEVKAARQIYRDVEKLYRLYGLYNRSQEHLEQHVKIVEANFKQNFSSGEIAGDWLHFHFLMSGVMYEGAEIFKADSPETTLGYMLFCEGVKTLMLSKGISAKDMLAWEARIRNFLDDQDAGKNQNMDLATLLWKNPNTGIRVSLYNALIDIVESSGVDAASEDLEKTGGGMSLLEEHDDSHSSKGIRGDVSWHERNRDWDLPSGELVYHQMVSADDLKAEQIERLRAELSDASVSDRAKKILPFRAEEVEHLRQEMEMFDENHVEFNLLARYFAVIKDSAKLDPQTAAPTIQALAKLAVSIVDRFHGGLILFYLKKLQELEQAGVHAEVVIKLKNFLKDSVRKPVNLTLLSEALGDPSRVKTAKQMIDYLEPKDFPMIFDTMVTAKREAGIQALLGAVIERNPEVDQLFLSWGEYRIVDLLPRLETLSWPGKTKFFARCLRIRSTSILEALLPLVGDLPMKPDEARSLYERLTLKEKHLFLEGLLSSRALKEWGQFVRRFLQSGTWILESQDLVSLWARVAIRHLSFQAFDVLGQIVAERRLKLWPRYPSAREAILQVLLTVKDHAFRGKITEMVERERGVLFQGGELKQQLMDYR